MPRSTLRKVSKFGKNLERCRADAKITIRVLAIRLCTSERSLYRWISGESTPRYQVLVRLASILKVDLNELTK